MAQTIASLQSLRELLYDIEHHILPYTSGCVEDYYCAGGAVRDTLLQKPVKDIDIYIRLRNGLTAKWLRTYINDNTEYDAEIVNEYEHLGKVLNVYGYLYDIQLIILEEWRTLPELLMEFPCSVSKVGLLPDGQLVVDPEFIETVSISSVITFTANCPWMYRVKIINKFPEFSHNGQHSQSPVAAWLDEVSADIAGNTPLAPNYNIHWGFGQSPAPLQAVPGGWVGISAGAVFDSFDFAFTEATGTTNNVPF